MAGGIYTDEKCPICGGTMEDNHKNAVCCKEHPEQRAHRLRVIMKVDGKWIKKRFVIYEKANRFLVGIRFKKQEGSLDPRDYQVDNPLGFLNLAKQWLAIKKTSLKLRSWNNLNNTIRRAGQAWGNRNIKEIGYAELEDFFFIKLQDLSSKSRSNMSSALHDFFVWLRKRRIIHISQFPEWPEVNFELAWRNTVTQEVQAQILDEVRRISENTNPRIWIAVRWLSRYFSIRPGELFRLKEREIMIDGEDGYFIIPSPKEKKPKMVPIIEEDVELIKALPRSFPELPFFRHFKGKGGARPGSQFGPRYIYKWWIKACSNLGISGVDLYGGTRHSTVIHLGQFFSPDQLKSASMHSTNKAFERYYRAQPTKIKAIYKGGETKGKQISPSSKQKPQ